MKKFLLLSLLFLSSCRAKSELLVCVKKDEPFFNSYHLYFQNKTIVKATLISEIALSAFKGADIDDTLKGLTYQCSDDKVIITEAIDLNGAKDFYHIDKTKKALENQGFKCE